MNRGILALILLLEGLCSVHAEYKQKLEPQPVFEKTDQDGPWHFSFNASIESDSGKSTPPSEPLFYAVRARTWPRGLIPVYQTVQKNQTRKLSRRLSHGHENFKEPLFFALPPKNEPHTHLISGRWACEATHRDGSIDFLHWELALVGDEIVGRFDQDTDYRFAWLTGGKYKHPHIQLHVEYIDATYALKGKFASGELQGTWRHTENADGGTWQAESIDSHEPVDPTWQTAPLFVSEDSKEQSQILQIGGIPPSGFSLLCLVWKAEEKPKRGERD